MTGLILRLALAAVAGGLAGWFARDRAEKSQRRDHEAHETEVVRAMARGRDRARDEKIAADERAARLSQQHAGCARRLFELERLLEQQAGELRGARAALEAAVPTHEPVAATLDRREIEEPAAPALTGLPRLSRARRAS